ncbi:FAD/NAD-P-binding domain-containing protein [Trametes cingulata]|nr:FAD/NAD-P-binding domain-containing protein [Trametes cingulata]
MSSSSSRSNPPLQAATPINFLIIGGGVAGLSCAIALRRVGHHVLVLERKHRADVCSNTGIRLPPNCTKILFHWGLKDVLTEKALITHTLFFTRYETGEYLGQHVWDEGVMKETRGLFMLTTHAMLYDLLHDTAVRAGVEVRYGCEVKGMDASSPTVHLASGEAISADVLVGADGEFGVSRAFVAGDRAQGPRIGLALYDSTFPGSHVRQHASFLYRDNGIIAVFGSGRAIVSYPIPGSDDLAFQWYGPDEGPEGQYGDAPSEDVYSVAKPAHETLHLAMSMVRKAVRISIRDHDDLEEWISEEPRLVLIGEAAHPFPPGTIQATAMAIEDGAVLAKLFSHLLEERQIESFLYAFQELRQSRVRQVRKREFDNLLYMTLPEGEAAEERDRSMRAKAAAGINVLEGGSGGEATKHWDEMETIFGYDCEDQADDWWVKWGVLRERALGGTSGDKAAMPCLLDFSKMTVHVSSTTVDELRT